jgi:hypothetical protein
MKWTNLSDWHTGAKGSKSGYVWVGASVLFFVIRKSEKVSYYTENFIPNWDYHLGSQFMKSVKATDFQSGWGASRENERPDRKRAS